MNQTMRPYKFSAKLPVLPQQPNAAAIEPRQAPQTFRAISEPPKSNCLNNSQHPMAPARRFSSDVTRRFFGAINGLIDRMACSSPAKS
jgi:hypothetical protein